jgi:hypothetical protein
MSTGPTFAYRASRWERRRATAKCGATALPARNDKKVRRLGIAVPLSSALDVHREDTADAVGCSRLSGGGFTYPAEISVTEESDQSDNRERRENELPPGDNEPRREEQ